MGVFLEPPGWEVKWIFEFINLMHGQGNRYPLITRARTHSTYGYRHVHGIESKHSKLSKATLLSIRGVWQPGTGDPYLHLSTSSYQGSSTNHITRPLNC